MLIYQGSIELKFLFFVAFHVTPLLKTFNSFPGDLGQVQKPSRWPAKAFSRPGPYLCFITCFSTFQPCWTSFSSSKSCFSKASFSLTLPEDICTFCQENLFPQLNPVLLILKVPLKCYLLRVAFLPTCSPQGRFPHSHPVTYPCLHLQL